jgi:hypothetical protein
LARLFFLLIWDNILVDKFILKSMSLTVYIWSLILSTIMALGVWVFVLLNIDPYESGIIGQFFFYFSLFLFLMGIMVSILVWLRIKFLGGQSAIDTMGLSFRQGFILTMMIMGNIMLNAYGYFIWWTGLLLVAGLFLVELYFLSREE